jgi:hypothetical protein
MDRDRRIVNVQNIHRSVTTSSYLHRVIEEGRTELL